ncbi:LegC family aminotransferase [Paenibacillus daejeonensis]|uniref:LegC family aminotransferase n=1 Tax=Paenibacillus daejeonensis TaxID=135193 RepID=UPI00037E35A2|nr:LegC family aminotransferase [Paenibacillus daejeonensis]
MTTDTELLELISSRLAQVVPAHKRPAALHEPELGEAEQEQLQHVLASGYISSVAPHVQQFESELARIAGVRHAIAVVNGTAALHLALLTSGVQPSDEVIVPALTFVATANAVSYCGAVPHFADSSLPDLGMTPDRLEHYLAQETKTRGGQCINRRTGRTIRAMIAVDVLGHPADLPALTAICRSHRIALIEDAAAALGSFRDGVACGAWGRSAAVSFNGNKMISTGGGGALLTNHDTVADAARQLASTAKQPHPWRYDHTRVAYNYRMPGLNAALGLAQLGRLPDLLARKRRLAEAYQEALAGIAEVAVLTEPRRTHSNYWLNALVLMRGHEQLLEPLLERLHGEGLQARPLWTPLHQLPMYSDCPRMDLTGTEDLAARVLCLPSSPRLEGPSAL